VLLAGAGGEQRYLWPLTNRVSTYLGDISYSLYLWHFPVIVFTTSVAGDGIVPMLLATVLSIGLGAVSRRFIEQPALRRRTPDRPRRRHARARPGRHSAQVLLAAVVAVGLLGSTLLQFRGPAVLTKVEAAPSTIIPTGSTATTVRTDLIDPVALRRAVSHASTATAWEPGTARLLGAASSRAFAPAMLEGGCRNDTADTSTPRTCEWGPEDADRTALVLGDSIALSWTPAVVAALGEGWRVRAVGYASCPLVPVRLTGAFQSPGFASSCDEARSRMMDVAAHTDADLVITSSADYSGFVTTSGGETEGATWARATERMLGMLAADGAEVILLEGTPTVESPASCATRLTGPARCTGLVEDSFLDRRAVDAGAARSAAVAGRDVRYVPTREWLCSEDGRCPTIVDGTLVRADRGHLTATMSHRLGTVLAEALRGH
jgi:hypothetical protein